MTGDAGESAEETTEQLGFCYVDLSRTGFAQGAASLLPEEVARRERAVPIERRGNVTVVAVPTPANKLTLDALRAATRGEVVAVVAPAAQVAAALVQLYGEGALRHGRRRFQHSGYRDRTVHRNEPVEEAPPGRVPLSSSPSAPPEVAAPPEMAAPPEWDPIIERSAGAPPAALPASASDGEAAAAPAAACAPPSAQPPPPVAPAPPTTAVPPPTAPGPAAGEGAPPPEVPLFQVPSASLPTTTPTSSPFAPVTPLVPVPLPAPAPVPLPASSPSPPPTGSGSPSGGAVDAAGPPGDAHPSVASGPVGAPVADPDWPALARALVASGRVSLEDMARAVRDHAKLGESLANYLQRERLVAEEEVVQFMAREIGLPFVDLTTIATDPAAAALVPVAVTRRHMVVPVGFDQGVPVIAMADPTNVFALDDLRSLLGRNFRTVVATRAHIEVYLHRLQEPNSDVRAAAQHAAGRATPDASGLELESLQSVVEDAPIVRYVNLLILQALNERASDIHIEPTPKRLRIRFRIDGVMHDTSSASPAIHSAVISRLKVLGEMDITEHRTPQEGRVSLAVRDRNIDLRLAILPSLYGESCVMRLLDKSASIRRLSELGFFPDTLDRYARAYNQPYGVILVTGPTGAGKTTTLYATLQEVMSAEKSVVTVEDPVEYQIPGITQVQINSKAGMHFSTALRSILRADPDIILVGEIRDIETASITMEAALSGHLVLSTLHTNTAASTPLRLTEMGIEPFLVTSAVSGVLTQRLARVLCDKCKTPYDASLADFTAAGYAEQDLAGLDVGRLYRANGCRTCGNTGYYGRMLLGEVMVLTEEIQRMVIEQRSILAMERQAVELGMRTLRQDGLRKAITGFTTLEEVLRVVA